mmetsp:Transcript_7426/g.26130  ORF Transcript_7426/g.26130 Transcript_7426/m.26130 type:complete len:212 (-) Transcript_7426:475-1110(-)
MPLAATSVTTSTGILPARNLPIAALRATWSICPYMLAHDTPSDSTSPASSSTWCLVEQNTTVCWPCGTTSVSMSMSAAALSSARSWKKAIFRSLEILCSASRRTSWGSLSLAFANSATMAGMVALNMSVCRWSASILSMSLSCSAKPISNRRSASSSTHISTVLSVKPSTSCAWCSRRPGVATMTSGEDESIANWRSMLSPPTSGHTFRSV